MHLYTYLKIHHKAKKPYIVIQSCSKQFFLKKHAVCHLKVARNLFAVIELKTHYSFGRR